MSATPAPILLRALCIGMVALVGLSACTDPPDLPGRGNPALDTEPYPTLLPIERILGTQRPDPEDDKETSDALQARVANLQTRASRLQGTSGIDSETRNRLNSGVQAD